MSKRGVILETLNAVNVLEKKTGADGLMRLEGTFGVCGVRNNNGRIYETKNYANMVAEMQKRIETEGCPGELEHPNTMNITLENVSHKIESINIDEEGKVTGTIVLLNTPKGQIAQAIVEGGLPLYISSRARGTVSKDGKVTLEQLQTYDLVGTPGFSQARLDLAKGQTFECLNESLGVIYDEDDEKQNIVEGVQTIENNNTEMEQQKYDELLEKYNDLHSEFEELHESFEAAMRILGNSDVYVTMDDVKSWVKESLAPAIQSWTVNEFAPEVQNWVVEEFAPEVQNWVVEEFAPEVQNWVVEEYTPMIDNWVSEELKPAVKSEISEGLQSQIDDAVIESRKENKADKLNSIDSILNLLESRKDNKAAAAAQVNENKNEDPYADVYCVANMPESVRPNWNMASQVVKESIVSKSKLYDFSKEGVLEGFWEKIDFTEPQAQVNENGGQKTITFGGEDYLRASLRATGRRLGYRD